MTNAVDTPVAPPPHRITRTVRNLRVKLTPEEVRSLGSDLARVCADVENEEASQKSAKSLMKARLEDLQEKREKLAKIVREEHDYRDVAVEVCFDYARLVVVSVRTDTGEIIETRPMKESERQEALPLEPDAPPPVHETAPPAENPDTELPDPVSFSAPPVEPVTDDERNDDLSLIHSGEVMTFDGAKKAKKEKAEKVAAERG